MIFVDLTGSLLWLDSFLWVHWWLIDSVALPLKDQCWTLNSATSFLRLSFFKVVLFIKSPSLLMSSSVLRLSLFSRSSPFLGSHPLLMLSSFFGCLLFLGHRHFWCCFLFWGCLHYWACASNKYALKSARMYHIKVETLKRHEKQFIKGTWH